MDLAELNPMPINATTIILTTLLVSLAYCYYSNVLTYFKKRGVSGPTPLPLVGNLLTILLTDRMAVERSWSKKYGKFYGIFNGTKPRFVINDPEVLRQICIKDFNAMPNHFADPLINEFQKNSLFFLQDDQWRRLRALQSPTFTSGKIKRMYKVLDRCAVDLVQNFAEQLEKDGKKLEKAIVNVKETFSLYTMDGITSAAYSIKLDRAGNSNKSKSASSRDEFVRLGLKVFELNTFRVFLTFVVPQKVLVAFGFKTSSSSLRNPIAKRLQPIIEQRQKASRRADDYLQILVDARLDDQLELGEMDEKENHHAGLTSEDLKADKENMIRQIDSSKNLSKAKLSDFEILCSAVFLLLVGLETTGNLLANCVYALAFHADIQQRLYESIRQMADFDEATGEYLFDYDKLTSCEYLDAVVSETLRSLTPVVALDRKVGQDYYVEKYNVQLKKGDQLNLAFYSIMNNPEFWPEPFKFNPERFMGDNKKNIVPGSYCPFGLGPRHCLGMRFSLTEAKLALAKVLVKFKITPAPDTKFPPEMTPNMNLVAIKKPLVEVSLR